MVNLIHQTCNMDREEQKVCHVTRSSHTLTMFVVGLDFRMRPSAQQRGRSSQVNNTKRQFEPQQPSSRVLGSFRNASPSTGLPTIIIRPQLRQPDENLRIPRVSQPNCSTREPERRPVSTRLPRPAPDLRDRTEGDGPDRPSLSTAANPLWRRCIRDTAIHDDSRGNSTGAETS